MTGAIWNLLLGLACVLLSGDFSGLNLLVGMIFGYIALLLIEPQVDGLKGYPARVPRFIGFLGFFIKELVQANLRVAFDILTPPWHMQPGVIALPLSARTEMEITLVANLISLTPGTLSLDVSDDRKVLYIHAMFLDDEEELRRNLKEMEHRSRSGPRTVLDNSRGVGRCVCDSIGRLELLGRRDRDCADGLFSRHWLCALFRTWRAAG